MIACSKLLDLLDLCRTVMIWYNTGRTLQWQWLFVSLKYLIFILWVPNNCCYAGINGFDTESSLVDENLHLLSILYFIRIFELDEMQLAFKSETLDAYDLIWPGMAQVLYCRVDSWWTTKRDATPYWQSYFMWTSLHWVFVNVHMEHIARLQCSVCDIYG